jgi:dihydroxy-acid dehydratase
MKPSAADPRFLKHKGPALAFESYDEMAAVINSDDLDVTPDTILILKNAGPVGAGMPEWGMMPIPKKLLQQGVRDMLRMSDARMSGTSYGACILHVSPEAAIGGPFALVRTGDMIELDVAARQLNMLVSEDELQRRRAEWRPKPLPPRGYGRMFAAHIQQAHEGCDFDFLLGTEPLPEPEIH